MPIKRQTISQHNDGYIYDRSMRHLRSNDNIMAGFMDHGPQAAMYINKRASKASSSLICGSYVVLLQQ